MRAGRHCAEVFAADGCDRLFIPKSVSLNAAGSSAAWDGCPITEHAVKLRNRHQKTSRLARQLLATSFADAAEPAADQAVNGGGSNPNWVKKLFVGDESKEGEEPKRADERQQPKAELSEQEKVALEEIEANQGLEGPLADTDDVRVVENRKTPTEWVVEARNRAFETINRSQEVAAQAQALNIRVKDLKAEQLMANVRYSVRKLIRDAGREGPEAIARMSKDRHELQAAWKAFDEGRGSEDVCVEAVDRLRNDAADALSGVEKTIRNASATVRRVWSVLDLGRPPNTAITKSEILEPPPGPGETLPLEMTGDRESPKTAAGCTCSLDSRCARRGRQFSWCVVQDTKPCQLKRDFTTRDAAGADHRVAATVPQMTWDYCVPPKIAGANVQQDALAMHEGCQCASLPDFADRYFKDAAYRDKDGSFDWARVPWRDRLALEAMVKIKQIEDGQPEAVEADKAGKGEDGVGASRLCVKTPSSGPHMVCPTVQYGEGAPSGWCSRRSWDICMSRKAFAGISEKTVEDYNRYKEEGADDEGSEAIMAMDANQEPREPRQPKGPAPPNQVPEQIPKREKNWMEKLFSPPQPGESPDSSSGPNVGAPPSNGGTLHQSTGGATASTNSPMHGQAMAQAPTQKEAGFSGFTGGTQTTLLLALLTQTRCGALVAHRSVRKSRQKLRTSMLGSRGPTCYAGGFL